MGKCDFVIKNNFSSHTTTGFRSTRAEHTAMAAPEQQSDGRVLLCNKFGGDRRALHPNDRVGESERRREKAVDGDHHYNDSCNRTRDASSR